VVDILTPEDFATPQYALIFECAMSLHKRGKSCDLTNIEYEIRRRGYEQEPGIFKALDGAFDTTKAFIPIEDHADALKAVSTKRRLALFGYRLCTDACGHGEGSELLEWAERELCAISVGASSTTVEPLSDILLTFLDVLERRRHNFMEGIANGIPTGFRDLDRLIGALQPADFIVLAARPSVGKTALALNIALNIGRHAKRILMFSLEMLKVALAQRLVAMEVPMDQTFMRDGDLSDDQMGQITDMAGILSSVDFLIDDRTRKLSDIKSKARQEHAKKPLDLIIIDYLQLVKLSDDRGKNENRVEVVGTISREMKELAMELGVPILALAQLNRGVEGRQDKRPQISDIRESGNLEQDADTVILPYVEEDQLTKRTKHEPFEVTVIVAKQRNGGVGEVKLTFKPRSTKFQNYEEASQQEVM
jgi:replicative DNA helicase